MVNEVLKMWHSPAKAECGAGGAAGAARLALHAMRRASRENAHEI